MNIYGEKIFLRALEERDNAMLRELMNDPETERLVCGASWPVSESGQKQWLANLRNDPNMLRCAVQCIESGESVGTVILSDIDRHSGTAELHIKLASAGRGKGYGTDCIKAVPECDYVLTCGPLPMLKAVHSLPQLKDGQFSFEARMGCGFGACMGCTVPTVDGYKRVCKDGPILYKEEIVW